jgi:hypothetical protein
MQQRNVCVVLGCIAEKMAGPNSIAILTKGTLDYLLANLASWLSFYCEIVLISFILEGGYYTVGCTLLSCCSREICTDK